ncbi:O-methyltransferase [Propioniferax innocua]|uniref:Putative O-methyltransferase YrrM n=1 Tax=Propioniferax innocua TaxID=1753 RepID=A0A542ZRD3_9ACTN|nr:O-methyltransferase [Propioniferax innocua]TQL62915.1 putative O-methyltransferase YrrM [Propioniferax innocua]
MTNQNTEQFISGFAVEPDAARQARERAEQGDIPALAPAAASTLTVLARAVGAKAVVEVGTGTGVSGLALLAGMDPEGVLTSVDIEHEHQALARTAFTKFGVPGRRFRLIAGAALEVLPKLTDEAYDIVFIDGDKLEYGECVEEALRLLRPGGVLVLNDALWQGKVADDTNEEDETIVIREALYALQEREDLATTLLPVGDGLLVAVR